VAQPRAKPQNDKVQLEVVLPSASPKKNVVRFETEARPVPLTNIYLNREAYRTLGNPRAVKVTIEAADEE